jgi:molybdopterin-guanine dinucleotide biosynthesis protein A
VNCYVLTGGVSRRMGESKAALFLPRVLAAAKPVFDDVIAVDHRGEVAAPIFGLRWALTEAWSRCFILAVDYPLITADLLRDVRDRGGVPVWNGHPQPLCAVWSPEVLPLIERRIAEGRLDLRGLIEEANMTMIPESLLRGRHPGEPLMNVNTPDELEEAEKLYGR